MRKLVLVSAVALLAVLTVLPTATQAVSGNLVATAGIPVKLYGDSTIKARASTIAVDSHLLPEFVLTGDSITLERVRVTSSYVPVAAGVDASGERRTETAILPIPGDSLRLVSRQSDLVLVATGRDANLLTHQAIPADLETADLWTSSKAQLRALLVEQTFEAPIPPVRVGQEGTDRNDAIVLPEETMVAIGRDATASLGTLDRVLFYGGVLRSEDGTNYESRMSRVDRPGTLYAGGAWTGPGTHVEETVDYFLLRASAGSVKFGADSISLFSDDLFVMHEGFVGFPWAEGRVETTNESIALHGEQVVLGGSLRLRPVGVEVRSVPQFTLLGDGDIDYVKVGVSDPATSGEQALVAAGGAAAGLGVIAALVYFWPAIKYGASLALFPLYARVRKEETLEHKGRELLYELIKNEPGVSTNQLAKDVPFGWSTLTYHLRVLERNEAIVSVRDGRYKRFFDRTSGRYSNGRKFVLAVLKNDATFDIARFIREKPGSSQKEVAGSFQLSPSSVHWHVERLSEVGLVQKTREAHNVKYFPGEGWEHITVEDLKALNEPSPQNGAKVEPAVVSVPVPVPSESNATQA